MATYDTTAGLSSAGFHSGGLHVLAETNCGCITIKSGTIAPKSRVKVSEHRLLRCQQACMQLHCLHGYMYDMFWPQLRRQGTIVVCAQRILMTSLGSAFRNSSWRFCRRTQTNDFQPTRVNATNIRRHAQT